MLVHPPKARPGDRSPSSPRDSPHRPSRPPCTSRRCGASSNSPASYRSSTRRPADWERRPRTAPPTSTPPSPTRPSGRSLATIGGDDQITVIPHLDADLVRATRSRSSATATTPTCSTGCGRHGVAGVLRRLDAGAPRPGPARRSRMRHRCGRRCSTVACSRSPSPASRRTSASIGAILGRSPRWRAWATDPWTWAGPADIRHRRDLGRMPRGDPVDPHGRPRARRSEPARRRRAARRDERRTHPGSSSAGSCAASANEDCSPP